MTGKSRSLLDDQLWERLRRKLISRKQAMGKAISALGFKPESQPEGDPLNDALTLFVQLEEILLRSFFMRSSSQLAAALQRMEDGKYGICENCGGQIPPQRLAVLPEASRCIECQTHYEYERKLCR